MNLSEAGFVILHSALDGNQNCSVHLFKPSHIQYQIKPRNEKLCTPYVRIMKIHGCVIFFTAPLPGKINANKDHILSKSLARQQWWTESNDFHLCSASPGV